MPNNVFPVRGLADKGVLRDPSSYQLDLNAFSNSNGVMYHANKAQSAPVIRQTTANVTSPPQWVAHFEPTEGYDAVFTFGQDGKVGQYQDQDYHDVSAATDLVVTGETEHPVGYSTPANSTQLVLPPTNVGFQPNYGFTGSAAPSATPIVIGYTYTGPTGESALGAVQAYTIPAPNTGIMVSGPNLVPGATGWNLYAGTTIQAPPVAAPAVTTVIGGSATANTTGATIYVTYVTAFGETPPSPLTNTGAIAANRQIVVAAPPSAPGVIGWNIYYFLTAASRPANLTNLVNATPIPITTTTFQITPQSDSHGGQPPTVNTAVTALSLQTIQNFYIDRVPQNRHYLQYQSAYNLNASLIVPSTQAAPTVGTLTYENFPTVTLPPPALPNPTGSPVVTVGTGTPFSAKPTMVGVVFVAAGQTILNTGTASTGCTSISPQTAVGTPTGPLTVSRPALPPGTVASDWAGWAVCYNTFSSNALSFAVNAVAGTSTFTGPSTYNFTIAPVDAYGNVGTLATTQPVTLTTTSVAVIAPLLTSANPDPSIVAYNVYYNGTIGGVTGNFLQTPTPVPLGNVTTLTALASTPMPTTNAFAPASTSNVWHVSSISGSPVIPIATTSVTLPVSSTSDPFVNYYGNAIPAGAVQATAEAVINASDGSIAGLVMTNPGKYPADTQAFATSNGGSITPVLYNFNAPTADLIGMEQSVFLKWQLAFGRQSVPTEVRPWTTTFLGQVLYANRPDGPPIWFNEQSSTWSTLPNMDSAWTARSMRAFGDYLIALNVTKPASFTSPSTGQTFTGGNIDNLFKWSDVTLEGQTPPSWDYTDPTTSAGENPLDALTSPIVDGLAMRNLFLIFTETEVWGAQQSGDNNIFNFFPVFDNGGMLAPNCGVSVEGIAYVFGTTDIYKTDGTTKVSIVDKRNRDTIFRNLNARQAEDCAFALYMPSINCVLFAYPTGDDSASFNINNGINGCNQGALYDIQNDTWGFVDLPNVFGGCMANADTVYTWEDVPTVPTTANWITFGGSWYDQQNTFVKLPFFVAQGCAATQPGHSLNVYDYMTSGNRGYVYNPNLNAPAFAERTGIALDQLGSDLRTYKRINRLYPLVSLAAPGQTMNIQVGWSNTPNANVAWEPPVVFDPINDYKIDVVTGGRYLAIRFSPSELTDFEIAGFDASIQEGGKR